MVDFKDLTITASYTIIVFEANVIKILIIKIILQRIHYIFSSTICNPFIFTSFARMLFVISFKLYIKPSQHRTSPSNLIDD